MPVSTRRASVALVVTLALCAAARGQDGAAEADAAVRAALARDFAFSFGETPLADALADIARKAGVEVVLFPGCAEDWGEYPVTWHSERSSAARALRWVTRLVELEFRVTDGAILVAEPEKLVGEAALRVYDVRDLSRNDWGWHAPLLGFSPDDLTDAPVRISSEGSIAEMIMSRVSPSRWDSSLGTSIEERDGVLIVFQTPEVQAGIETLLAGLRAAPARAVSVEVVVLAADAAKPAVGQAGGGALAREDLERLVARAGEAAVIARATLATLDGRTAHTVWGAKTHYVASKALQWPEVKDERFHENRIEHEVVPYEGAEGPKAIVVKTPSPPPALPPPGEGAVVPSVDALLDGVLVEVTPRLDREGRTAEIELRVVISHPREIPGPHDPEPDAIQTPTVDYSRLATTTRVPVGRYSPVGTTAVRRGEDDVAALVLACVSVAGE